jgi:hypothetical protein
VQKDFFNSIDPKRSLVAHRFEGTTIAGEIGIGHYAAPQDSALTARSSATQIRQPPVRKQMSAPSRLTSIRSTSNWKTGLFGLEPPSGRLLQIHVQPAPAFLMEANTPPHHQAAFATDDALFIACK